MKVHDWELKRGYDMVEDGYMRIELCENCGGRRIGILRPDSDQLEIVTTVPAGVTDICPADNWAKPIKQP